MSGVNLCPECECELPSDAPGGFCPECLLRQGMSDGPPLGENGDAVFQDPRLPKTSPGASTSSFTPLTPSEIAPLFPQLEILGLVGHGGMGAVYKARQTKLDRLVALKIIRPESADDPTFAERFTREARTLARLSHPSIVAVHDFGEVPAVGGFFRNPAGRGVAGPDAGPAMRGASSEEVEDSDRPVLENPANDSTLYYFVMEYVDGANLRQLMEAKELSPNHAVAIVPQICEALQYAHDEGVVHRDIKPENILLDTRGRVKIADFGLARLVATSPADFTLTATHQVMGTPRYMAPEQMAGSHSVDHRADIYSLGVVFYEMLTGEVPVGHFDPPSKRAAIDIRLDEVVLKSLASDPDRRFQRATEIRNRLDEISVDLADAGGNGSDLTYVAPPRGPSTILEHNVAAAVRWFRGHDEDGNGAASAASREDRFGAPREKQWAAVTIAATIVVMAMALTGWSEHSRDVSTLPMDSNRIGFVNVDAGIGFSIRTDPGSAGELSEWNTGLAFGRERTALARLVIPNRAIFFAAAILCVFAVLRAMGRISAFVFEGSRLLLALYGVLHSGMICCVVLNAFDVIELSPFLIFFAFCITALSTAMGVFSSVLVTSGTRNDATPGHSPRPISPRPPAVQPQPVVAAPAEPDRGDRNERQPEEQQPLPARAFHVDAPPEPTLTISDDVLKLRRIESDVKAPAAALMVAGFLGVVFWCAVASTLIGNRLNAGIVVGGSDAVAFFGVATAILLAVAVILIGSMRMRNLTGYEWCIVASILAMIPWTGLAAVVCVPIGFWAFRTLRRTEVRDAFLRKAELRARRSVGRDWVTLDRASVESDTLPDICMVCGDPTRERVNRTFSHTPDWACLLLAVGFIPGVIAMALTTRQMRAACPLCPEHRSHWSNLRWTANLGWLLIVLQGAVGMIVLQSMAGAIIGAAIGLLAWIGPLIYLTVTRVGVTEITDSTIRLQRVSSTFARACDGIAPPAESIQTSSTNGDSSNNHFLWIWWATCLVLFVVLPVFIGVKMLRGHRSGEPAAGITADVARPDDDLSAVHESADDRVMRLEINRLIDVFHTREGRYPADHDEFMERVINENDFALRILNADERYQYNVDRRTLDVVRDSEDNAGGQPD